LPQDCMHILIEGPVEITIRRLLKYCIFDRVGKKSPVGGKNHGKFRFLPFWTLSYGINWQKLKTINICNIKIYL